MATKIRYNVHTTNKYSVFDSDNSEEETENKNLKESTKNENNDMYEKIIDNSNEIKKSNELKSNSPVNKEYNAKKPTNQHNDRYKFTIPTLNEVNENSYRNYRDNFHSRGNIRNKFARKRGGGYSNVPTSAIGNNNFYRGSRNYDYKMNIDRRNYNNAYNYNKFDFREKMHNEYNENSCKYDNIKRENILDLKNKNCDENIKATRKHESVTIDYDLYRRQQEKKLNSNKTVESTDKKKKKNEMNNEKSNKISNNTKRNDIDEENKTDHPKRKAINVYQYILEEGGRVDRIPGFRRSFRNFRKGDENNWPNKNEKTKMPIDEKIFKKRDPPNINDTRAFPSLTSK
ncbi:conserved Plasmodium protein, unknown function [Plasmodium gallinaceum]|uniref:Uncharacterized protein n=1 Tax=Plasmodium gallinaceum TaxID=5849 RepID=A0A1J1GQ53_PLAGA|nr:conserved Plasmodium protein, unknown function [Plasmodium gallinaceum]CRG94653.1 conserved Plasmodium protein, unknown function [Plasmodium gallinaceum]